MTLETRYSELSVLIHKEQLETAADRRLSGKAEAEGKIHLGVRYGARLRFGLSIGLDLEIEFFSPFGSFLFMYLYVLCLLRSVLAVYMRLPSNSSESPCLRLPSAQITNVCLCEGSRFTYSLPPSLPSSSHPLPLSLLEGDGSLL